MCVCVYIYIFIIYNKINVIILEQPNPPLECDLKYKVGSVIPIIIIYTSE